MNSINIPRYCNGNLVYDEIPMNSIITTSTLTSGYSYINSNNNGILVKNNNDISFKTFDGILYYKNNELTDCVLSGNTLIYTNVESTLSQINISGGVLNTYKFDDNSVDTSNADPSFTDKIVLNNCEIVDDSNQRINKNYLIYGNSSKHGLSPIELDTPSNNYEYYYIVNDLNNNVNISTASQIYTNLYNTVVNQESIIPRISAIPICNSTDNQHLSLSLIIPQHYNNGNYYIKSDGSYFSLETIYGSILPSSLKIYTKDFNYSNNKILTIGKNNFNEDVFIPIQSSTSLKKPYLSGTGWGDLTYTTFLNSNNLSITKSLIYSNPVVIGTNGSMYGVILPENKKYILTKSSFKELQITGSDITINDTNKINLKNIIQIKNDSKLYKLEDKTLSSGILHTTIDGDIVISLLTNNDIQDNTITGDKIAPGAVGETQIANNSITRSKLNINDSELSGTWKNLLIDNNNNFVTTGASVTHYGVFNNIGGVQDLNSAVLNEIGLNLYIPDGNENEFNQTFVSANCRFYTNDIINKYVYTNYIKVYNYFNSNNSSNKIIYVNNSNQITDTYSNIKNTYEAFYAINKNNNIDNKYNIKLKVSLNIKDVQIDLTNTNNSNFSYNNLDNTLLKSGTILIVGVYTSLCKLNDPSQVLVLPNKIFRYNDNSNYCKSALLGYLPILVNTIENEKINNINIDKIFDFECTVDKNNFFLDEFKNIKNDLLFFVPMYYYKNNTAIGLNYGDRIFTKINGESTSASIYYTNMCLNNDNSFTITCTGKYVTIDKLTISSSDITINDDSITINNYNSKYNINHNGGIFYIGTDSNYNNFMNVNDIPVDDLISIQNNGDAQTLTFEYFLNEPIEKNIKIFLSPITNQSNIIYTTKDTGTNELKNTITYKFSLCSINLSLTKNTGEYPTQFKMS